MIKYAKDASKVLGFKVGPIHMEIKNKEAPVMIEVGARLHGGVAPNLFAFCYKPPLLEMAVNSYFGLCSEASKLEEHGRIEFAINEEEKRLNLNQNSINDLQNTTGYKGHKIFFKEGDVLPKTTDLATTPAISYLSGKNEEALKESSSKAIGVQSASIF